MKFKIGDRAICLNKGCKTYLRTGIIVKPGNSWGFKVDEYCHNANTRSSFHSIFGPFDEGADINVNWGSLSLITEPNDILKEML